MNDMNALEKISQIVDMLNSQEYLMDTLEALTIKIKHLQKENSSLRKQLKESIDINEQLKKQTAKLEIQIVKLKNLSRELEHYH